MRNISAVQRPMPRTSVSSVMISSSDISGQRCTWILPSAKCCARSRMYSHLRSEKPQALMSFALALSTSSGETTATTAQKRFQTLCAALTEICWPQIALARVMNGSPRRVMNTFGCPRMIAPRTGSRRARERFARSQYSGFIQRQVENKVLGFHFHEAILVRSERKIDRAAGDVLAHLCRVIEIQPEQREDTAHAASVHLFP